MHGPLQGPAEEDLLEETFQAKRRKCFKAAEKLADDEDQKAYEAEKEQRRTYLLNKLYEYWDAKATKDEEDMKGAAFMVGWLTKDEEDMKGAAFMTGWLQRSKDEKERNAKAKDEEAKASAKDEKYEEAKDDKYEE